MILLVMENELACHPPSNTRWLVGMQKCTHFLDLITLLTAPKIPSNNIVIVVHLFT